MKNAISILFGVLLSVALSAPCNAEGINQIIINPSPDRTWNDHMGGLFRAAKSYAVVISISDYIGKERGGYPKLATHDDAKKMASFLSNDMGFDYVHILTDTEVTKTNLEKIMLDEIRTMVGPSDRFVFYWSGHGDQFVRSDTNTSYGFLPLYDSRVGVISSMISMDDIARWNGFLQARHALFVLDACLSGLAGVNAKDDPRVSQLSLPARFLLTAGTATEEAVAGDRWGGSLFTDTLIRIGRENIQTSDGVTSVYKIFDDLQKLIAIERQKSHWQKTLTPQLRDLEGGGGAFFFAGTKLPQQALQTSAAGTRNAEGQDSKSKATGTEQMASKSEQEQAVPLRDGNPTANGSAKSNRPTDSESPEKKAAMLPAPGLDKTVAKDSPKVVDHCRSGQQVVNIAKSSSSLSLSDAFRAHLGAVPIVDYQRTRIGVELSNAQAFDLGENLRKFRTSSFSLLKCDGHTFLVSYLLYDGQIPVATIYVDRNCDTSPGTFDMKAAFDGIVADMHLSPLKPGPATLGGSMDLGNSVLSYVESPSVSKCAGMIVHAAKRY